MITIYIFCRYTGFKLSSINMDDRYHKTAVHIEATPAVSSSSCLASPKNPFLRCRYCCDDMLSNWLLLCQQAGTHTFRGGEGKPRWCNKQERNLNLNTALRISLCKQNLQISEGEKSATSNRGGELEGEQGWPK